VPRYEKIKIAYTDQQGGSKQLIADDFIARVFQHEYDHLNGLLYLDRVEDNRDIISEVEFQKMIETRTINGQNLTQ
jgi:peptide deformylase